MKTILLFLSYCIDFQARNFERQPLVQLDPKEIKTQILERLKHQKQNSNTRMKKIRFKKPKTSG
ncbi:hypothetical protein HpNP110_14140 [Helicobacter pylori]